MYKSISIIGAIFLSSQALSDPIISSYKECIQVLSEAFEAQEEIKDIVWNHASRVGAIPPDKNSAAELAQLEYDASRTLLSSSIDALSDYCESLRRR